MKLCKILLLNCVLVFVTALSYSQDVATENSGTVENKEITVQKDEAQKADVATEKKEKQASGQTESKEANIKEAVKKNVKKTEKEITAEVETQLPSNSEDDEFLMPVKEGNFKYNRIPDIKLEEKTPSAIDIEPKNESQQSDANKDKSSFLGLSKGSLEVLAKGGILFVIFISFILYRARSKNSSKRGSSAVMKSYRK